jgi:predicted GNAT family acetyltransferase
MAEPLDVIDNTEKGRFEIHLDGDVAFAEYLVRPHAHALVLPHTVTPEAFAGKGVASRLAQYAMAYARSHGLKVIPTCPFMANYIQRHPEVQDLVHPHSREKLGLPPLP